MGGRRREGACSGTCVPCPPKLCPLREGRMGKGGRRSCSTILGRGKGPSEEKWGGGGRCISLQTVFFPVAKPTGRGSRCRSSSSCGDKVQLCQVAVCGCVHIGQRLIRGPPNHQQWYAKWKLSWNMYTLHTRFCTFGTDLYAQSVIINNISAAELSQNFIKSVLLVGPMISV